MIEHEGTMYAVLKKYGLYDKREDYIDICYIGYTKALNSYDESKGTLRNYIYNCVENAIISELYKEKALKRKHEEISIDFVYDQYGHDFNDLIPSNVDIEKEIVDTEQKEMLNKAIKKLSKEEQYIIQNLFNINGFCLSTGQLASKLHTNLNCILRIKEKSLMKLKEILNER